MFLEFRRLVRDFSKFTLLYWHILHFITNFFYLAGNYSRLACEIQFVRSMGYYLIQIYIPSSLIVVISWVSFWLNRGATPARVGLGVTTVLTMTTLMASTNAALPKISYVKSIDVYLGACFFMVFASLLGNAIFLLLTLKSLFKSKFILSTTEFTVRTENTKRLTFDFLNKNITSAH